MDTLYIADIPQEYHFAIFGNNYIDLYNTQNLTGTLNFYRVYLYNNAFYYEQRVANYNQYNTTIATEINVSSDRIYRRDYPSIMFMSATFILFLAILVNLITSVFKKGGLLGGLF